MNRREEIEAALDKIVKRQRGKDFEYLGTQVARIKWPDLIPTAFNKDLGQDAISLPGIEPNGRRRSVACSLTAELSKVREDCTRIRDSKVAIDELVFVTAGEVTNQKRQRWTESIKNDFGLDLVVLDRTALIAELELPDRTWLCEAYLELHFPGTHSDEEVLRRAKAASAALVEGWVKAEELNKYPLLDLDFAASFQSSQERSARLSLAEAVKQLMLVRRATLIAPGGGGKTWALIRVAQQLLGAPAGPLPVLVRLADLLWSNKPLLDYVAAQVPFSAEQLDLRDLARLTANGQLAFLCDGWNELPPEEKARLESLVVAALREAPASVALVSTREPALLPAEFGALTLAVRQITREMRRHYIECLGGDAAIASRFESDAALDELTRLPFFLRIATEIGLSGHEVGGRRYQLLAEFVLQVEMNHYSRLRASACGGQFGRYLESLAADMTTRRTSGLTRDQAVSVVASCAKGMIAAGVTGGVPDALSVLEALVANHVLAGDTTFRFQH